MSIRSIISILILSGIFYSCSSSSGLSESSISSDGLYPGWYSSSGFSSDSSSFSGFGTAIAADSSTAILRATIDATKNLDLSIGKMVEDIRTQLVRNGEESASNTDFILITRNAHSSAVESSETVNSRTVNLDGVYRAMIEVSISRIELSLELEKGFTGHPRYWTAFSNNDSYRQAID